MTAVESAAPAPKSHALARALARVRGSSRAERIAALAILVSFAVTALLPLTDTRRYGDLNNWYTDHLHHSFAAWVFLHQGFHQYDVPFRELWANTGFRHPTFTWEQMPGIAYPPGAVAVFLPLTLIGQYVPMGDHAFGVLSVVYLLFLSHLSFAAVLHALRAQAPGVRWLVGAICWVVLIHLGLQGFFDGVWVGCAAMMLAALARRRHAAALVWFGITALIHFRAVVLAPMALAVAWQVIRTTPVRRWPWGAIAFVLAVGALDGYLAHRMFPATAGLRQTGVTLLMRKDLAFWTLVGVSACAAAAVVGLADVFVAGTVLLAAALAVTDYPFWWHASLLLVVPLSIGAAKAPRAPSSARVVLALWLLWVQPLAWRDEVTALVPDVVERLTHR